MSVRRCEFRLLPVLAAATLAGGCAWIYPIPTQTVAIDVLDARNQSLRGVLCTAGNDKGTWSVVAPGHVDVLISRADLTIECRQAGAPSGFTRVSAAAVSPVPVSTGALTRPGSLGTYLDPVRHPSVRYPARVPVRLGSALAVDTSGNAAEIAR